MKTHRQIHTYKILVALSYFLIYIQSAHAYLDPGTGSMLLAAAIGILSTLLFTIRTMWHKILSIFSPSARKSKLDTQNSKYKNIVCYSEGRQYWNTFLPIVEALDEQKKHLTYLTSDVKDPGLQYDSPYIHSKFIGTGNKAYTYLNLLHAKICLLTTPNLDTLQIRRSKGVSHYVYVLHSPTDIHLYKLFAFDFYDSFFVSGPHQEASLRHLEKIRNTKPKKIFNVGCPYIDVLHSKKEHSKKKSLDSSSTVLIAPTWGKSGLLSIAGEHIIQSLVDKDYNIIVRPHPQSLIVEKDLIEYLQENFTHNNITWDNNPDNFETMNSSDLLISERSGIIFDFAFVFEKPILTYVSESIVLKGMEGNDIPWDAWELNILPQIGRSFAQQDIPHISHIIQETMQNSSNYIQNIQELRKSHLYNFGHTKTPIIESIHKILKELD